jgi:hypothetical protein
MTEVVAEKPFIGEERPAKGGAVFGKLPLVAEILVAVPRECNEP